MFECGCSPSYEGGYGYDGRHGRYSMEWCSLHAAALEMYQALQAYVFRSASDLEPIERKNIRALLAKIDLEEIPTYHDVYYEGADEDVYDG